MALVRKDRIMTELNATKTVVVSRDPSMLELFRRVGLVPEGAIVLENAKPEDLRGANVVGTLPLHLAVYAKQVTVVPVALGPEQRGKKLSADELQAIAGAPRTFEVRAQNWRGADVGLVVTRHPALVEFLKDEGYVGEGVKVVAHISDPNEIACKNVFGILPLELAAVANEVTEVPLTVPKERWNVELSLEELRGYAGKPQTYKVTKVTE